MNILQRLKARFALFWGKHLSLNRMLNDRGAEIVISFVEGRDDVECFIKLVVEDTAYYFGEGGCGGKYRTVESFTLLDGHNVRRIKCLYSGWEVALVPSKSYEGQAC